MPESSKSDNHPLKRRQAALADGIGERILSALNGRTMKWLSDETGVSTSMLSDYARGKTPGADKALAISEALGVDLRWLLTGLGESGPEADRFFADRSVVELDQIDLRYGLGGSYIDGAISSEKRQFSREWLRQITRAPPEMLFWVETDGDSMEPTIRSREVVLIDRGQDTVRTGDGIWAVAYGDVGMIKRLRPLPDGTVELHSDNDRVPPTIAADGELHVIGRVVAVVRRL